MFAPGTQVLLASSVNCPGLTPPSARAEMLNAVLARLVTVTVWVALGTVIGWLPKANVVAESLTVLGVTLFEAAEATLVPTALVALTVKV